MTLRALVVAALALPLSGCGSLFFLEAETEEICKGMDDMPMPGMPGGQAVNIDTGGEYAMGDLLGALPVEGFDGVLELLSLSLKGKDGVSDLSFVEAAQVSVV